LGEILAGIDEVIHLCIVGGVVRNAFITLGMLLQQSQTTWEILSGIEICRGNTTNSKHCHRHHHSSYPPDQVSQSQSIDKTTNDKGTFLPLSLSLSQQTAPKIRELKKLMHRYPIFPNADMVIQCVTHFSMNGDNSFLDEKLEYFRMIDNAMGYASTVCDA
jgi:hypothetical protein